MRVRIFEDLAYRVYRGDRVVVGLKRHIEFKLS